MFHPSLPHGVKATAPSSTNASAYLEFTSSLTRPITITSSIPITHELGRSGYRLTMPIKTAKTAVGFRSSCDEPASTAYLTPSYGMKEGYVSLGGMGFVYPATRGTGCHYGEGEGIDIELDFRTRRVIFRTSNGKEAEEAWPYGDTAFLAISSEGGPVVVEISML